MRPGVIGILCLCLSANTTYGGDRVDELFASWESALHNLKSLAIDFTIECDDPIFQTRKKSQGAFRFLRTSSGRTFASLSEVKTDGKARQTRDDNYLLVDEHLYSLDFSSKTAVCLGKPSDDQIIRSVETYFLPLAVLLDKKQVTDECNLEIVDHDESQRVLLVNPKEVKRTFFFPNKMERGALLLMNSDSKTVPKDMPQRLRYWFPDGRQCDWEISSWICNTSNPPTPDDFRRPEDRAGWKVQK